MDGRLARYVREQWPALVEHAVDACDDASEVAAQEVVLAALTRVAARWRIAAGSDSPATQVGQAVARACRDHNKRQQQPTDVQLMEIDVVPVASGAGDGGAGPAAEFGAEAALAEVRRRVHRLQRNRLLAAAAAVVVVVAVTVTVIGSGSGVVTKPVVAEPSPPVQLVPFPVNAADFVSGITSGGGYIWTIESRSTRRGSRSYIVQRSPASGHIQGTYGVPEPDDHIGYGLGRAWAWHDNTDFPTTAIATVDRLGNTAFERSTPPIAIQDAAFNREGAWFTEPQLGSVMRLGNGQLGDESDSAVAGAKFVIPINAKSVLVAGRTGTLYELPSEQFVYLGSKSPTLLEAAPAYGIWLAYGRRLTFQTRIDQAPNVSLTFPYDVRYVTGDPATGIYVALDSKDAQDNEPYLVYYSPAALASSHPQPTARLTGELQVEGMVADPLGGVAFITNNGAVVAWRPGGLRGHGSNGGDHVDHAGITSSTRRITPRGGFA